VVIYFTRCPELYRFLAIQSIPCIPCRKAHPSDEEGKRIIQRLIEWCSSSGIKHRIALIENYDGVHGPELVQGVDVWLNNLAVPWRPLAASRRFASTQESTAVCWMAGGPVAGSQTGKGFNGWAMVKMLTPAIKSCKTRLIPTLYQPLEMKLFLCTMTRTPMDSTAGSDGDEGQSKPTHLLTRSGDRRLCNSDLQSRESIPNRNRQAFLVALTVTKLWPQVCGEQLCLSTSSLKFN